MEVKGAAMLAGADTFIRHLPQGYDTMISGDGIRPCSRTIITSEFCTVESLWAITNTVLPVIRLSIADPPVLILDEATSSIDTRTEVIVQRGMDSLMTGKQKLFLQ